MQLGQKILQQGIFQIDPNATPEDLARRRQRVQQMFANGGQSQSVGEGAIKLAGGIFHGLKNRNATKFEGEKRAEATSLFDQIMGAASQRSSAPTAPILGAPMEAVSTRGIPDTPQAVAADTREALGFDFTPYAVGGAAARSDSFSGLDPNMQQATAALLQAADAELGQGALKITSAYRSPELQQRLFDQAVAKYGSEEAARKWVAPAGRSQHNHGNAIDFAGADGGLLRDANSPEAVWLRENAAKYGLAVPMDWEPWQVELAGARGQSQTPAPQPTQMSTRTAPVAQNNMQDLMAAMANPWMSPEQKAVISSQIAQMQQANDPLRQLQIQQAQVELERARNPQPGYTLISQEEAASLGLGDGAFQRGPDGRITKVGGGGVNINLGPNGESYNQPITPGQEALDKAFAAEYATWTGGGGGADSLAQIDKVETVLADLESGEKNLTGPGVGSIPDAIGTIVNPDAVNARETVEEVVQRNLRLLLGPQFTAKEGEQLIARAYNPRLREDQNATRLRRLVSSMRAAHEDKQSQAEYFEQNGTLTGWTGRQWSLSDFEKAIEETPSNMNDTPDDDGWTTLENGVRIREVN